MTTRPHAFLTRQSEARKASKPAHRQPQARALPRLKPLHLYCQAALAACVWLAAVPPVQAQAVSAVSQFDLPAQPLSDAINALASRSGVQIAAPAGLLRERQAPALNGRYTVEQALDALLRGTGLEVEEVGGRYVIRQPGGSTGAGSAGVAILEAVEVTGQLPARMEIYDVPASVSVVTRAEIDRLPPRNVGDVLVDIPGVATSQSRQNPGVAVNIRGLQGFGRVNVMIDGARQNYQQSGHGDSGAVYLDADLLSRVDVSKGPVATLGGAGMIGGMVNFRTLTIDDLVEEGEQYGGRVNLTSGSNAYHFAGSAAAGWRFTDQMDLTVAISRKQVGSFRKGTRNVEKNYSDTVTNGTGWLGDYQRDLVSSQLQGVSTMTDQRQLSGLAKLGWQPNVDHRFTLGYVGFKADYDEGELDDNLSGGVIRAHNSIKSETVTLQHEWQPDNRWFNLRSSMYFTSTQNDAEREAQPALDIGWSMMHFETNTFGLTTENESNFSVAGLDATWKLGGEFYRDWTRPGAVAEETGVNRGDPELMVGGTPRGQRTVTSGFTDLTLRHGNWLEVGAGLRYDWFGLKGDGLMSLGKPIFNGNGSRPEYSTLYTEFETSRHQGSFAPSFRLAVRPVERVQLFANYGRGIRPPSITESFRYGAHPGVVSFPYFPNPNLNAERSRNWEVGANFTLDGLISARDQFRVKAAWFNTKVNDYIVLAAIMSPGAISGQLGLNSPMSFINLQDEFRTRGLEIQADYDAGIVFGSAGYTHSLIDTGNGRYDPFPLGSLMGYPSTSLGSGGGADIWYLLPPAKKFTLSGGVRLFEQRWTIGARMRHETPANNTSVFSSNGYSRSYNVYDAWTSFDVTKNLTARLSVENLLNENYAEMNGITYWIAPGRTVMASVNWRF